MNKYLQRFAVIALFAGACDFLLTPKITGGPRSLTSFFVWVIAFYLLDFVMNSWNTPRSTHSSEMDANGKLKRWVFSCPRFSLDLDFEAETTKFSVRKPVRIEDMRKEQRKYSEDARPSSISETVPTVRLWVSTLKYTNPSRTEDTGLFNYSFMIKYRDPPNDAHVEYFSDLAFSVEKLSGATNKSFREVWPLAEARIAELDRAKIERRTANLRPTGS